MDERTALLQRMLGFANCYLASRGKKEKYLKPTYVRYAASGL